MKHGKRGHEPVRTASADDGPRVVTSRSIEPQTCYDCGAVIPARTEVRTAVYPGWERRWWHPGCFRLLG